MFTLRLATNPTTISPLPYCSNGRRNPFYLGVKTPLTIAVFLCVTLFEAGVFRLFSVMACLFGQASRLAAPRCGFRPHLSTPPGIVENIERRLSTLSRNTAMTHSSGRAQSAQNSTTPPLFSIFWHRQCICIGITGTLAMRFKRRFPECRVKFVGFTQGASEGEAV